MKPWDQMTVIEQMRAEYSDLHKDVFGFRPSIEHRMELANMTDVDFVKQFDTLLGMIQFDNEFEQLSFHQTRQRENKDWWEAE